MGFAELPAARVANILNLELLVHAWDVAKAKARSSPCRPCSPTVLGLARNTISPQMRGTSFAEETLAGESAVSLDRAHRVHRPRGRWHLMLRGYPKEVLRNTGKPAGFPAVVNVLMAPTMRRAMKKGTSPS